jgi:hypothetical protein
VARGGAILQPIDRRLRVLDAHAQREILALDRHAGRGQPLVHRPRGVADRQHHGVRRDLVAAPQAHGPHRPALAAQADRLALEAVDHALALQMLAQRRQHLGQQVRAHVRPRLDRDLGGRAEAHEIGQHLLDAFAILAARVELAVGVRARAAFTEAVVRVGIQRAPLEVGQIAPPRLHGLAPLEDGRRHARLREPQRRPGPRGARADDDHGGWGPARRPARRRGPDHGGLGRAERHAQVVAQRASATRVQRSAQQAHLAQAAWRAGQRARRQRGQGSVPLFQRDEDVHDLGHGQRDRPTRRRADRQCRPPCSNSRQVRGRSS